MTKFYVDSSLIVSILFNEKSAAGDLAVLFAKQAPLSSLLLEAEVLAAARREGMSLKDAVDALDSVDLIYPDRSLAPEYDAIFTISYCRGADAHHLATALFLDPTSAHLTFLTADKKQGEIAKKLGFKTRL